MMHMELKMLNLSLSLAPLDSVETHHRSTPMSQSEDVQVKEASLSQQQVVQFIQSIMLHQKQQEPTVTCSDVKVLLEELHLKKTIVYRSIPYSRLGSNRDAHCYRKAYPHLLAFKRFCQEGGRLLLQDQRWEEALEFTLGAWWCTASLPQWEVAGHNVLREQCYGTLADLCTTALRHHRPHYSQALELFRRYTTHGPIKVLSFSGS
ncbi:hypothetical protein Z043_100391 [Scleropages formosus]|uniref:Uncharacterized protein n=1 Tax=Scleropages formosus TaxID=113540 RepID=A0A0P7W0U0_SCLFO|nr:hypothetical protein Z043_100391 [Scleropages formosus]